MKPIMIFYQRNCPFCKKAFRYMEEAMEREPELRELKIELVEETEQPEFADKFDYYYVPTFYVGGEKVHEGGIFAEEVVEILRSAM
ncbi:MAG: thioredoxin family protein [Tidjanibacter sp.]|nr:thioredoxin family protein [Tidjanibacter sp.]MBR6831686.1 thioredoxin family protein [Tidjanibacter sp.]